MRRLWTLLLLLSFGLLLAACGGAPESSEVEPAVQVEPAAEEVVVEKPAAEEVMVEEPAAEEVMVEEPAEEMAAAEDVEAAEEDDDMEEAAEAPAATPTVRVGLHASNPADFQLASGSVQLVEFFAFW